MTQTLLGIFAHPDDEAFGTGGTFAKYASQGVDVHIITATSGDAGSIADTKFATRETLAQVREQELHNACEAFGINPPHLLGLPDGQLTVVSQLEAVGRIVGIIRKLQPQVVLGFGPDGVYGHYDHIACHRWMTIGVRLAADSAWFPEQLEGGLATHAVSKVYHRAASESWLKSARPDGLWDVMMDGVPFTFYGYPDDHITTHIDVGEYITMKRRGILCHKSQIRDPQQFADETELAGQPWFMTETYIRAYSTVTISEQIETDLFAGLTN